MAGDKTGVVPCANDHLPPVRKDPAIERWADMQNNQYRRFKFTPKNTRSVMTLCVTVPLLIGWAAFATQNKIDIRGAKPGESLWVPTRMKQRAEKAEGSNEDE